MEQIPTAEEYFKPFRDEDAIYGYREIEHHLKEFAKLHVEAALKVANEEAIENDDLQGDCYSGRYHMKNCYPLENIK